MTLKTFYLGIPASDRVAGGSRGQCVSRPVSRPRLRDGTLDPGGRERLW